MSDSGFKHFLFIALFVLLAGISFGIFWFLFLGPSSPVGLGWYLFSFAAGLTMIVLPCTLPLAFVIVPLSMGKGALKGFMIALFFGLGVAITLSFYGVLAALLGKVAIGSLGAPLEVVKNWLYFIAGAFAYFFALGELGLITFRMPSYTGAFPAFIQKRQDVLKALLLGLFLGNIGVGCPHPATPVILTRIAVSGDIFYGWLLFFIHAVGRVLPLIFLAILGIVGINALSGLVKQKEKIERATGWGMIFVAGFILILGLFSHDWWVLSGQHTYLEEITGEHAVLSIVSRNLNLSVPHEHGLPPPGHTGLFGLPLGLGTWVLLFLWILPLWWHFMRRRKAIEALREAEREHPQKDLNSLFWNFFTLSVFLIIIFGYLLPQRFLAKSQTHAHTTEEIEQHMAGGMGQMEGMTNEMMDGEMMAHEGHTALYYEESEIKEGIAVNLNFSPPPLEAGKEAKFDFFVNRKPEGVAIDPKNLEIQHEKIMHVIGVRKDLTEFFHIHPEPAPGKEKSGVLFSRYTFKKPGEYKIWSEIKYHGESHVFGHPLVMVRGEGTVFELQKEIVTNKIVDRYQVGIDYNHLRLGEASHIDFFIKDFEGRAVSLENYLGEKMHLSIISEDVTQFIHTHPDTAHDAAADHHSLKLINKIYAHSENPNAQLKATDADHIGFTVNFTKAGFYKVFGQFKPTDVDLGQDESLVAEFWIEVAEQTPQAPQVISDWWRNLIISLLAILALSFATKKFMTVI